VFREQERYEALAEIHDDLVSRIQSDLPPESERTTATMALLSDIDDIWMYKVNADGYLAAHTRPCQPIEAFGSDTDSGANVDMEAMLEADPDVIFALGGMHPETDIAGIRQNLEDHSVGSSLSAVQNDRVYAQGGRFQGPILNLFQLEMSAKQLYPDQFGEWPWYESGPYPELPAEQQLFDRQRVADIINGDFDNE
jgi:ABC-type Fe3+-hydroxamate transport system substrate-binding protein